MARGRFYETKAGDVWQARDDALQAAAAVGRLEPTQELIDRLIASEEPTRSYASNRVSHSAWRPAGEGITPLTESRRTLDVRTELRHLFLRDEPLLPHQQEAERGRGVPKVIEDLGHLSVRVLNQAENPQLGVVGPNPQNAWCAT
jgi:hypothetical protein